MYLFQIDWGAQRVKSAQGTIKIRMKSDFSSDLTHFITIIGGGGSREVPKKYTVTPLIHNRNQNFAAAALILNIFPQPFHDHQSRRWCNISARGPVCCTAWRRHRITLFVRYIYDKLACHSRPTSLCLESSYQGRIEDFSQEWAPSDGLVLEC